VIRGILGGRGGREGERGEYYGGGVARRCGGGGGGDKERRRMGKQGMKEQEGRIAGGVEGGRELRERGRRCGDRKRIKGKEG